MLLSVRIAHVNSHLKKPRVLVLLLCCSQTWPTVAPNSITVVIDCNQPTTKLSSWFQLRTCIEWSRVNYCYGKSFVRLKFYIVNMNASANRNCVDLHKTGRSSCTGAGINGRIHVTYSPTMAGLRTDALSLDRYDKYNDLCPNSVDMFEGRVMHWSVICGPRYSFFSETVGDALKLIWLIICRAVAVLTSDGIKP